MRITRVTRYALGSGFVILLVAVFATMAQSPAPMHSGPTQATAASDLRSFLNLRTGRWSINNVTQVARRETYQVDADVEVTVEAGGQPRKADLANDPWLSQFSGKAGEKKTVPVTLTWVRSGDSWKLRTLAIRTK